MIDALSPPRPLFRGAMHGAIALLTPAGLVLLLLLADSPRGYVGASIYATTLVLLYGTSASYHLVPWPARLRRIIMRLDHAMIFVLIAGTYTPFSLIVVGDGWGVPMLSVVWTLAGLGVLLKVLWPDGPRWLSVALYIGLGWLGIIAAWPLAQNLSPAAIAMLVAGGMLYTVGALAYAARWPDPNPRVFGYHEVFHSFVAAASALHFALIATYLL
jgi:hemolysin III